MVRLLTIAVLLLGTPFLPTLTAQTDEGPAGVFTDTQGGRVTASGEVYDPAAMTAGHPNLRFGIRLAVTNPANGRSVTVRVNDRGPSPEGRVVNLSRAAAEALGVKQGDRVEIRALRFDEPGPPNPEPLPVVAAPPPEPAPSTPKAFVPLPLPPSYLQVGAFRTVGNALRLARGLAAQGFDPQIRQKGPLFRVYLTSPDDQIPSLVARLTALGRRGFFQTPKEPEGNAIKLTTE